MELLKLTAKEAADKLHNKEASCVELTKASLEQIKAKMIPFMHISPSAKKKR